MRILVADDDSLFLTVTKDILSGAGHQVVTVKSGTEALEKAVTEQPDLIILDVILPGLLGTEVAEKLRMQRETASVPILLVSSGVAELNAGGDPEEFMADGFLMKPVTPEKLLRKVQTLANLKSKFSQVLQQSLSETVRSDPVNTPDPSIGQPAGEQEVGSIPGGLKG